MKRYRLFLFVFFLWAIMGILTQSHFFVWTGPIIKGLKYIIAVAYLGIVFKERVVFKKTLFHRVFILGLYIFLQTLYFQHAHPLSCIDAIIDACWWSFPPIVFYWITIRLQNEAETYFKRFFIRLLFAEIFLFFVLYSLTVTERTQSNMIYWTSLLLPFVFLITNKSKRNIVVLITMLVIMFSLKRSAFIYGAFSVLLIIFDGWTTNKNPIKTFGFVILMASAIFAYVRLSDSGETNTLTRFGEGAESGDVRSDIYEVVWEKFLAKTPMEKAFGNGYLSTLSGDITEDLGYTKTAHNDFLEVLCDYGIIGLIMYLLIIVSLIKCVIKSRKIYREAYLANLQGLVTLVVMSSVSHLIIYPTYVALLTAWWGINEGLLENGQQKDLIV